MALDYVLITPARNEAAFIEESMICTFLNATTADGYNPYRITREGIDRETPEPNNPWANIGYWSDHQIVYLQKLMEISAKLHPGRLEEFLTLPVFSHANVPYRIKRYKDVLRDPFNTIEFNWGSSKGGSRNRYRNPVPMEYCLLIRQDKSFIPPWQRNC